ncbi:MAG: putative LacI-family transcriptional regulator, partial [Phycisphaerales bacterium]|nr:putative LacI-family transcriptional regulator [Phycisphaerales bacterium]
RGNYEGIMAGINETLSARGYHVMFVPLGEDPAGWGELLTDQRLDGCLVLSRLYQTLASLLEQVRLPVALVNADSDLALPIVLPDDNDGARQLTRHLLDLGHRRITFFLGDVPPHYSVTERIAGYQTEMQAGGASGDMRIVRGALDAFVETLRDPAARPTAIITYTHFAAITLLRLLWEANVRVPHEVSVATFSDSYPVAEVVPPLTVMALPTEAMGRAAAAMVLEQIDTAGAAIPRRLVLGETLIVRRSTAGPPGPGLVG